MIDTFLIKKYALQKFFHTEVGNFSKNTDSIQISNHPEMAIIINLKFRAEYCNFFFFIH